MSLIKCPECGKEISNQSIMCIYCGYPIIKSNECNINGVVYDLTEYLETALNNDKILNDERENILNKIQKTTKLEDPAGLYYKMVQEQKVPKEYFTKELLVGKGGKDFLRCPFCGSTNISKRHRFMARGGYYKSYDEYTCHNCKHEWK